MRNIIVSINVGFRETEDLATENDGVERMDDGSLTTYQFVLNHGFRAFQQISCNGKSSS
jgi:hypothetical protein